MYDLYSGFKKVSEDDKHAVLEHENGHRLNIAKTGVSRKHLKALSKLPLHQASPTGVIPEPDKEKPDAKILGQELGSEIMASVLEGIKESVSPTAQKEPEPNATDIQTGMPVKKGPINQKEMQAPADTSQYGMAGNLPLEPGDKSFQMAAATKLPQVMEEKKPEPQLVEPQQEPLPVQPEQPVAQPAAAPMAQAPQVAIDNRPFSDVLADPSANSATKMEAANRWAMDTIQRMKKADDDFDRHLKENPITVPKLFSGMNFLQGIATSIGLLIGGAGSGRTGGPNLLLQKMNDDIMREVDAQKRSREEKFNLYSMHMNRLKDEYQAALQTENNVRQIAQQQFDEAAGRTGIGPAAREAINLARQANQLQIEQNRMGLLQSKYRQQVFKSVMAPRPEGGATAEDPSALVPVLVPQEHQKEVYKSIDAATNTRHMANSIMHAFEQAIKENTAIKTGAGLLRTPGSVLALHQHMQPTFADLEGTVRQSAMDNTFKNVTPMPGDSEHTINQKREALMEYLQSKASASTAKAYGIDLRKFEKTAPYQSFPYEGKIAVNKKTGEKIIGRGGRWVPYAD
jgi:hypothetical protein